MWQSLSLLGKFNDLTMYWVSLKGYNHWILVWCCWVVLFQEIYRYVFITNWFLHLSKYMLLILHPFFNFSTCKKLFIHDLHLEALQFFSPQTEELTVINWDFHHCIFQVFVKTLNFALLPSDAIWLFVYCLSREYIGGVPSQTSTWKFQ